MAKIRVLVAAIPESTRDVELEEWDEMTEEEREDWAMDEALEALKVKVTYSVVDA